MKSYNLLQLGKNKHLGHVILSDDYRIITFEFDIFSKTEYSIVLERLIQNITKSNAFGKINFSGYVISNGTEDLWKALVQSMMINLKIVVSD